VNTSTLLRCMLSNRLRRKHALLEPEADFIDIHAHYVPEFYIQAMRDAGVLDMDGWLPSGWSASGAIEVMDQYGIAAQILSLPSPGLGFLSGSRASQLARDLNTHMADLIRTHSPRFGAFAAVPLPDIDAALEEIHFALDNLALDGVALLSNYNGIYLGDGAFEQVVAELNRRGAVVFVHPTKPPNFQSLNNVGLPAPVMEYPFETTRMAANLVRNGVLSRYPDLRVIVAHAGGAAPYLFPRLLKALGAQRASQFRSLYYDLTATTAPAQTAVLRDAGDTTRFLMGFDFPFTDLSSVRPVIAGLPLSGFSRSQLNGIRAGNAAALFPNVRTRLRHSRGETCNDC
jgi:predicted TIM-barrel fold metal-dependent hydrolase